MGVPGLPVHRDEPADGQRQGGPGEDRHPPQDSPGEKVTVPGGWEGGGGCQVWSGE